MENSKEEQDKVSEQQASQVESPTENQPKTDIYEEMKSLPEEQKNICPQKINEFIQDLYTRGLIQKMKDVGVRHVPISISPSPIPKNLFEKIFFYQIAFNKIYNKLSNDQIFLEKTLEQISLKDNFIKELLEISKKALNYEKKQKIKLSFFRNDYILDKDQKFLFLKQFITNANNFEFSFTNILLNFFNYYSEKYKKYFSKYKSKEIEIPQNKGNAIEKFTEAIIEAIKLAFPQDYKTSNILFIVNEEQKKFDFHLENLRNELFDKHEIRSFKLLLNEVNNKITKDEEGNLLKDGNKISLVYFNSIEKKDYQNEEAFKAREFLELSTAIKVPDINTYLTSLKVFQYYLSKPDIIIHYNYNELIINDILRFFGEVYYLPDKSKEERNDIVEKIKSNPDKYILFSNEEKTGDNLKSIINSVGEDLPEELINGIIIEKYNSPEHDCIIIKDDNSKEEKIISEYSIYGIILMNENNLIINKSVSFLIKSGKKGESLDIFDLPCLVETKLEPNLSHKVEVKAEDIQKYLDELKAAEEEKKRLEEEEKKRLEEEAKKKEEEEAKKKEEEERPAEDNKES
jgi:glutathione synthase